MVNQGRVGMSSKLSLEEGGKGGGRGKRGLSLVELPSSFAGSSGAQLWSVVTHAGVGLQ